MRQAKKTGKTIERQAIRTVTVAGDETSEPTEFLIDEKRTYGRAIEWTKEKKASVAVDWCNNRLQFLVYDKDQAEPVVSVRINPDGTVAEAVIEASKRSDIRLASDSELTPWLRERDAEPATIYHKSPDR